MIQQQIFTVLTADEDVAALAGTRVYPLRMPQRGSIPAVVYQVITTSPVRHIGGDSGLDLVRLQTRCWAATYSAAQELAFAVRNALTSSESIKISTIFEEDDQDQESLHYCIISQFSVWSEFDGDAMNAITQMKHDEFHGDGSTKEFTLTYPFRAGSLIVFYNGVLAKEGAAGTGLYTTDDDRTKLIFNTAPAGATGGISRDEIFAYYAPD